MSAQQKNTAFGAGVGHVVGAVLTSGGVVGNVDASVIGGRISHELDKANGCSHRAPSPVFARRKAGALPCPASPGTAMTLRTP